MSGNVPAIGIDLGTTTSCVGMWKNDKFVLFENEQGKRCTFSCVSFTEQDRMVGDSAKLQIIRNPSNTITNVKRLIGRRFSDANVQKDKQRWPFKVFGDCDKIKLQVQYKGEEKILAPEEITAMILYKMKEIAEKHLQQPITDAVISAPAYFTDSQRQATKDAGAIAGLNILRIINEPTAAAIAYGICKHLKGERNVLIFDLGGGTFDVSVVRINNGSTFEVKSTAGDTQLGGQDFENRLFNYFAKEFKKKYKKNITRNLVSVNRLHSAAELAKNALSSCSKTIVEIDSLFQGVDFHTSITRSHFEKMCEDLFLKAIDLVKKVLNNAQLDKSFIHDVVLVGGSSRMPKIRRMLNDFFCKPINYLINPDEAVTYGAAVQAAILSGVESSVLKNIQLIDITPLSLGIETSGSVMTKMIQRNSRVPCKQSQTFSTYTDNQLAVTIQVFEGERPMSYDNNLLGIFNLTGIPPAPRGTPQIQVTFDLDNNGILNVTATESSTGKTQHIVIENNKGRLSVQEIDKMLDDAEKYKTEDELQEKRIHARNQLEGYIFNIKETLYEDGDKLSEKDKTIIISKCDTCLKWLDRNESITVDDLEYQLRDIQIDISQIIARYNTQPEELVTNILH